MAVRKAFIHAHLPREEKRSRLVPGSFNDLDKGIMIFGMMDLTKLMMDYDEGLMKTEVVFWLGFVIGLEHSLYQIHTRSRWLHQSLLIF